mmetsp:Transcript_719/g.2958  ORF Transcript_719/g.2958 Transcript_719/m.2958 type:complete len:308 (+) Transcript_719:728-1651(+)
MFLAESLPIHCTGQDMPLVSRATGRRMGPTQPTALPSFPLQALAGVQLRKDLLQDLLLERWHPSSTAREDLLFQRLETRCPMDLRCSMHRSVVPKAGVGIAWPRRRPYQVPFPTRSRLRRTARDRWPPKFRPRDPKRGEQSPKQAAEVPSQILAGLRLPRSFLQAPWEANGCRASARKRVVVPRLRSRPRQRPPRQTQRRVPRLLPPPPALLPPALPPPAAAAVAAEAAGPQPRGGAAAVAVAMGASGSHMRACLGVGGPFRRHIKQANSLEESMCASSTAGIRVSAPSGKCSPRMQRTEDWTRSWQ